MGFFPLMEEAGTEGEGSAGGSDSTPAGSGDSGTTQPDAENSGTTPDSDEAGSQDDTPSKDKNLLTPEQVEKAMRERLARQEKQLKAQWEQERKKAEERAKMEEKDRLAAEKKDLEEEKNRIQQEYLTLKQEVALRDEMSNKVRDVKKALRLFDKDRHMTEDGEFQLEKFLEEYPEEAASTESEGSGESSTPGVDVPSPRSGKPAKLSREAISKMSTEEYEKRREEIHQAMREGRIQ